VPPDGSVQGCSRPATRWSRVLLLPLLSSDIQMLGSEHCLCELRGSDGKVLAVVMPLPAASRPNLGCAVLRRRSSLSDPLTMTVALISSPLPIYFTCS
jgi:hypothetical protein